MSIKKEPKSNLAKLLQEELKSQSAVKEGFIKSSWIKSTRPLQDTTLFKQPENRNVELENNHDDVLPHRTVEVGC